VFLVVDDLPSSTGGGVFMAMPDGSSVIALCRSLTQVERRSVLAHELIHDERGGGCDGDFMPAEWAAVVAREERLVDDTAVLRLVPPSELLRCCVELEMACTHVEPHHIAEAFHVTEDVARRALELQDQRLTEAVARTWEGA
jgi:hypothetical protein